ncbi:MAG: lipoate--protein ligase family protein, partial [Bacteroidales bacterium]|nr:lipoate--protein ligase family protein [Bacteroidales bacterium]
TASHVFKRRSLHHGTLLFSSKMEDLSDALKVQADRFNDRAVKSVRSKVTNIQDHLVEKIGLEDFQNRLLGFIFKSMDNASIYQYNDQDMNEIQRLSDSKFSTWEWNYGYSPKYEFSKQLVFNSGKLALHMNVEKGIIRKVNFEGEFMTTRDIHGLEDVLVGTIHDPETLRNRLSGINVADYITGLDNEILLSGMF